MEQRYICITGASSGIGQALATYYTDNSEYELILSARTQSSKTQMERLFPDAYIYVADFSLEGAGAQFAKKLSGKDIAYCILAAGCGSYGGFQQMQSSGISEQMSVNTTAPLEIIHSCLSECIQNKTKIVYLSSLTADMPLTNMSVYAASKRATNYALERISQSHPDLRLLNLHLGAVQTPMHIRSGMQEMKGRKLEEVIPKMITYIETKCGNRWMYPDWLFASYIVGPTMSLIASVKKLGKRYL